MGSVPTGPLQPLPTIDFVAEGFRMNPCNLSELIRFYFRDFDYMVYTIIEDYPQK